MRCEDRTFFSNGGLKSIFFCIFGANSCIISINYALKGRKKGKKSEFKRVI